MIPDTNQDTEGPVIRKVGMTRHLSQDQWQALSATFHKTVRYASGQLISQRGEPLDHSLLLVSGLVARSIPLAHSARSSFVAIQFAGDFVDLHAFPLSKLDHDIVALTDVELAVVGHDDLQALLDERIDLVRILWKLTLVDAAIHRQWSMRNSAMRGFARVANFFSEFDSRHACAVDRYDDRIRFGLSKKDIADATGMTLVHLNRCLKELADDECCELTNGTLVIVDRDKLRRRGCFEPTYLYQPESDGPV